jgi:hypothetical protein
MLAREHGNTSLVQTKPTMATHAAAHHRAGGSHGPNVTFMCQDNVEAVVERHVYIIVGLFLRSSNIRMIVAMNEHKHGKLKRIFN